MGCFEPITNPDLRKAMDDYKDTFNELYPYVYKSTGNDEKDIEIIRGHIARGVPAVLTKEETSKRF